MRLLLALAVSGAAALEMFPAHQALRRDLLARQTVDASAVASIASAQVACLTALESIYSTMPTAPADLVSWEVTAAITDPCSTTFPASIESAISSYESAFISWFDVHSDDFSSALTQCPQYTGLSSIADDGTATNPYVCSTPVVLVNTGTTATTTAETTTATTEATTGTATDGNIATGTANADATGTLVASTGARGSAVVGVAVGLAAVLAAVAVL